MAMKEDRRGSSLPQHNETAEGGCLIKIEHLGPLVFCVMSDRLSIVPIQPGAITIVVPSHRDRE